MEIAFRKMHGLGNDFVVLDRRAELPPLERLDLPLLADRRRGIGCDQIVVLDTADGADIRMRIFNADGSAAGACGNAARCVAWLLARELGRTTVTIAMADRSLECRVDGDSVTVAMGKPGFDAETDGPIHMDLPGSDLPGGHWVDMGNPHIVFFVDAQLRAALPRYGPAIEQDGRFPGRINVSFATVQNREHVRLDVWERGAGATLACGSAACATVAAGVAQGLMARAAEVTLPGGTLTIRWPADDAAIEMTGPACLTYEGHFLSEIFAEAGR